MKQGNHARDHQVLKAWRQKHVDQKYIDRNWRQNHQGNGRKKAREQKEPKNSLRSLQKWEEILSRHDSIHKCLKLCGDISWLGQHIEESSSACSKKY